MNDSTATLEQLKGMVRDFCRERDWDQFHNPKDLAIGMVTESSELLETFRFKTPDEAREMMADPVRSMHAREEVSDVLYFLLRFAETNGIELFTDLQNKLEQNRRKYPVEKCRGRNLKYDEL